MTRMLRAGKERTAILGSAAVRRCSLLSLQHWPPTLISASDVLNPAPSGCPVLSCYALSADFAAFETRTGKTNHLVDVAPGFSVLESDNGLIVGWRWKAPREPCLRPAKVRFALPQAGAAGTHAVLCMV